MNETLWAGPELGAHIFSGIRRRTVLEGCKWDPQVGDVSTLAAFPLIMSSSTWKSLAGAAERLASEALAAEEEILRRPKLLEGLGFPRPLRDVLRTPGRISPAALRAVRFDFHPTTQGWRISEANCDVPGGYSEGSFFTALVAEHFPKFRTAGNPAAAFAEALHGKTQGQGRIALLAAPGYMEDQQVIAFLAKAIRARGLEAMICDPRQIQWQDRTASVDGQRPAAIVRFFQSDWLARLPKSSGWRYFFRDGQTPLANPGSAVVIESKRFPLVWDQLDTPLPTWRALLPETRDPREAPWHSDDGWLLKTAFCDTGDTVSIRELMPRKDWLRAQFSAHFFPNRWLAQRRFESIPVQTPIGPRHACVGVFTINGRAAGAYCRLAPRPLIDFAACDVPLLLQNDE